MPALEVEHTVLAFQRQVRSAPPPGELIVLDGKEPHHTRGQHILTAVTAVMAAEHARSLMTLVTARRPTLKLPS